MANAVSPRQRGAVTTMAIPTYLLDKTSQEADKRGIPREMLRLWVLQCVFDCPALLDLFARDLRPRISGNFDSAQDMADAAEEVSHG